MKKPRLNLQPLRLEKDIMTKNITSNRRIAKNTLYMYIRMFVTMSISLFTSRVILNCLGVEDYGIYNVVAGVVVMFTFISNALSTGTQRHLSYELGRVDSNISKVFSACSYVHVVLGIIVLLLCETIGLWLLNYKLVIPCEKLYAANIVLQFSIFSTLISIVRVPYEATIIAYEKMSFYAYFSIAESVCKLVATYAILYVTSDRLSTYAAFQAIASLVLFAIICIYCHVKFPSIAFIKVKDFAYIKQLFSFSGWTMFGSASVILETQGLNIIMNLFFGVLLNAAVGIANMVKNVMQQFVSGFQIAFNPQLVKIEATKDRNSQTTLLIRTTKFSYLLLSLLAFPLLLHIDFILNLWLGKIPEYTTEIATLVILTTLVECLSAPLYTTIYAVGDIKYYQIVVSIIKTIGVVIAYLICKMTGSPILVFALPFLSAVILLVYRLQIVSKKTGFKRNSFYRQVVKPVIFYTLLACLPLVYTHYTSLGDISVLYCVFTTILYLTYLLGAILLFGLSKEEVHLFTNLIRKKI